MSRRTFLARPLAAWAALVVAGCAGGATGRATGAPDVRGLAIPGEAEIAAREQTADQQVLHALNRVAFGPRPGDEARVRAMGVDRWIALQLEPSRIPDAAGEAVDAAFPLLALPTERLLAEHPPNAVARRLLAEARARPAFRDSMARAMATGAPLPLSRRDSLAALGVARGAQVVGRALVSARVARAVASERQLEAVLTDFWLNHFNVHAGKGNAMRHWLVAYERDAIRPHVLGKFRTLLGAVAHSPAMLFYLDNVQSVADSGRPRLVPPAMARRIEAAAMRGALRRAPAMAALPDSARAALAGQLRQRRRGLNENYARELLELHTLGVDGGYTQRDVGEAARILTGWSVERPYEAARFRFNPLVHDAGEKTVLGTRFPAGRGVDEGERLLDLLARHPSTARHVATKLARRFVSDTPPAALVERAAATFTRTDGDLRETMRTILASPEFFSRAAWRAKVKSPFEVVTSAMRALGASIDTTPRAAAAVARLGQPIFGHQAPNGWPETGEAWVNTGAILNRINFGMALAAGQLPSARPRAWPAWDSLATEPRDRQVDGVVRRLLGGDVSADMRAILVSGDHPFMARARAAADSVPDADDATATDDRTPGAPSMRPPGRRARARGAGAGVAAPENGLAQVLGLALGSPEFQRR